MNTVAERYKICFQCMVETFHKPYSYDVKIILRNVKKAIRTGYPCWENLILKTRGSSNSYLKLCADCEYHLEHVVLVGSAKEEVQKDNEHA